MKKLFILLLLIPFVMADSITLNSPENEARLYETAVTFSYTPNMNNITKCELYINDTKEATDTSVEPNEENTFEKELEENLYEWQVKCIFNETTLNSDIWQFTINTTRIDLPDIVIEPDEITKTVKIGFEYKEEITVTNRGNETAYNITFNYTDDIKFYPNNFNLTKDEEKTVNVTIKTSEEFEKNIKILTTLYYFHEYEWFNNETNQTEIRTEYVSDEDLFRNITFHLSSLYETTEVSANVMTDHITINTTEKKENAIIVENIGNYSAIDINLSLENVEFPNNNFTLEPAQATIIVFNMTAPPNLLPQDTNKTYDYNLKVTGKNFDDIIIPIHIFVPYSETPSSPNGTFVILPITDEMLENFCKQFPEKCPSENVTVIKYREKTTPYNFTDQEIKDLMTDTSDLSDNMVRIINEMRLSREETQDLIKSMKDYFKNQTAYIDNLNKDLEEDRKKRREAEELSHTRNMLAVGSIFLLILTGSGFYAYRWWKKRKMDIW